jgi:hypothetical protein
MAGAATDRWKLASSTAPAGDSPASANSASMAARPIRRESSTSVAEIRPSKASLMRSLANSGSASSSATVGAKVDLPLPGGPDTIT